MDFLFICLFVVAHVAASRQHYATIQQQATSRATNQHHHENSGAGTYSYGYSDDHSAKAEHKSINGLSRGFYAYLDTNGDLQTVEYVAGGRLGFQVAATILPKPPVPVKDTPEVQMAKKAHFEAYREAELRAALAAEDETDFEDDDDAERKLNGARHRKEELKKREREDESENMLQSDLRERQQLLVIRPNSKGNSLLNAENQDEKVTYRNWETNIRNNILGDGGRAAQMTTFRISNNDAYVSEESPNFKIDPQRLFMERIFSRRFPHCDDS